MFFKKIKFFIGPFLLISVFNTINAEEIELRVGDSLPPDHIIARHLTFPWIEKVKTLSEGRVKIKHFPAEQSGKAKDMLSLTQSGVLDIGYIGPTYVSDKMPLSGVAELPGLFSNSCQVTKAYWSLAKGNNFFYEKEFKPNNIRPLLVAALPPYQITISSNKKIEGVNDFSGMKVRAAGGAQELSLNKLKAVPVKMAPPDIYESMSRKTIDGALLPFISLDSYKLSPLIKTSTQGANFGTVILTYSISDRAWNKLPDEIKDILMQAGDEITNQACEKFDQEEEAVIANLKAEGVHLLDLSDEDKERLEEVIHEVAQNWVNRLDSRNKPGSETLEKFYEALESIK